jgi:hypothetical protein
MLLTRTELDFLLGKREFSKGYSYTTKSRLLKKLELLVNQELPILIEKGYLTADCKVSNGDLTAGSKVLDSIVRISQRIGDKQPDYEGLVTKNNRERRTRRALISGSAVPKTAAIS